MKFLNSFHLGISKAISFKIEFETSNFLNQMLKSLYMVRAMKEVHACHLGIKEFTREALHESRARYI
jgi:hypothetical protein